MTYEQIRGAFDRTASLAERARGFVKERNYLIAKRETPTPVTAGPIWTIHFVPLAGLAERRSVDLRALYTESFLQFVESDWGNASRNFNFDGLVVHPSLVAENLQYCYKHIFRTGAMEAASTAGGPFQFQEGADKRLVVWSLTMTQFFHKSASTFLKAARSWGYSGPALLSIAILNVQGYELVIGEVFHRFSKATADRPDLIPPGVWIENIDTMNVDDALRPSLDVLWQAFGATRCLDFDETTGAYRPRPG